MIRNHANGGIQNSGFSESSYNEGIPEDHPANGCNSGYDIAFIDIQNTFDITPQGKLDSIQYLVSGDSPSSSDAVFLVGHSTGITPGVFTLSK